MEKNIKLQMKMGFAYSTFDNSDFTYGLYGDLRMTSDDFSVSGISKFFKFLPPKNFARFHLSFEHQPFRQVNIYKHTNNRAKKIKDSFNLNMLKGPLRKKMNSNNTTNSSSISRNTQNQ